LKCKTKAIELIQTLQRTTSQIFNWLRSCQIVMHRVHGWDHGCIWIWNVVDKLPVWVSRRRDDILYYQCMSNVEQTHNGASHVHLVSRDCTFHAV